MIRFAQKNVSWQSKRAVPHTPRGSMTVEASLAIPIFLFATLCLIYILEMHALRSTVLMGAQVAAKQTASALTEASEKDVWQFGSRLLRVVGKSRLDRSMIYGGSSGIDWTGTRVNDKGQLEVDVRYELRLPFPGFSNIRIPCREQFIAKGWNGYEPEVSSGISGEGTVAYITDTGSVYHESYDCPYLKLSIHQVSADALADQRNEDGGKYHACEKCAFYKGINSRYYITNYGDKYHCSLLCSGLKRSIHVVSKEDLQGRRGCSKCTQ